MSNVGKKTLTPDTQLAFTCFLNKHVLTDRLLYYGWEGVEISQVTECRNRIILDFDQKNYT